MIEKSMAFRCDYDNVAAEIVNVACGFKSEIRIKSGSKSINAKSIMGVLLLVTEIGDEIIVTASGDDEADAITAMEKLFTK